MKKTLNAIEMMLPEGIEPIAYACSGYLRAFMWQSEDGCHFAICREDPINGEFDTTLTPADLEHLAKLTAAIANTFHLAGNPEIELVNDLGCLAHCLGQTLGVEFDDAGRPIRGNIQQRRLMTTNRSIAAWRNMTTNELISCQCGGPMRLVDSHGQSCTGWCTTCEHYSLVLYHRRDPVVIFLEDFHVKRGNAFDQRPFDDLEMANALAKCLIDDVWPSPATIVDFGIDTPRHLGALQQAIRFGYTAYDLDRVMGDGPAITRLVNAVPRQLYGKVEFHTVYDKLTASLGPVD